ncbi:hypothetical protein GF343_02025 [Candidatus Woesearchaeota archaeon]|nr:hypothetical protein [Candidatus Woesearchaeota archaeon]
MKRAILFLVLFVLFAGTAAADCTDTDGGKNYAEKGETKIISGKEDICILSPSAEVRQDTSAHLKEYYCDHDDQIKSEIIECTREGFEKCEMGKCVGGEGEAKAKDQNYTAPKPAAFCGDSIVDEGEECDPMNKICFDDEGNIGLCNEYCKCEIKITKEGTKTDSGDTAGTDTNETTDVEIDTPTEKEAEPEPVVVKNEEPEQEKITVEITEKKKQEKAPKGFFSKIWAWISSWFS